MPPPVRLVVRAITALNRFAFYLAAALIYVIVPVMLVDVVMRYAFNRPTDWGMETALLLFGPYFLLAGPYVLHLRGHVAMDILRQRLSARANRLFELINIPIIISFTAILLAYAAPLALDSFHYRETSFSAWNPPIWWTKMAVPLALLLMLLQASAEFLRVLFRDPTLEIHPHG